MDRLLVTGASGFIGKGVLEELQKRAEYEIYAVTTDENHLRGYEGIHIVEADILDAKATSEIMAKIHPQKCIHLAWRLAGNNDFMQSDSNLEWLKASIHLLQQFVKQGGKRMIFAGSSSEYGFFDEPLKENKYMECLNLYGYCKRTFTEIGGKYCNENQVSFATARFFSVYGRYDNRPGRAIPSAIRSFYDGEKIVCKSPNAYWDYIYIDDAANAVADLTASDYNGIMNIGSGKLISMKEVFTKIARQMKAEHLLSFENENEQKRMLVADNSKMLEILGERDLVKLEDGMERTIEWFTRENSK